MWMRIAETFVDWIREGRVGRVVGLGCGLFLGVIYLAWGFWDMLVFALIIAACYALGKKSDNREKWVDINAIMRWFSDRRFR